jgi:hypothetical protein
MAKKARKGGPSASQLIREYVKDHPGEGPTAVANALNSQHGTKISAQFVSTVKSNAKKKGAGGGIKKKGKRRGRPAKATTGAISITRLLSARDFVREMGGVKEAKAAVDFLADLSN